LGRSIYSNIFKYLSILFDFLQEQKTRAIATLVEVVPLPHHLLSLCIALRSFAKFAAANGVCLFVG
jgi:hypothetical protein